jgi:hypothetical protein
MSESLAARAPVTVDSVLWGSRSPFSSQRTRLTFIVAALALGVVVYAALAVTLGGTVAIVLLAAWAAAPPAVSKTATACGINVLHTFSRYENPLPLRLGAAVVYAVVSGTTALALGLFLSATGSWLGADRLLVAAGPVALYAGFRELSGRALPVTTSRWQVPARWVRDARVAPIVWGVFLGSGLATWMPRASFYALLFLSLVLPYPGGALVMLSYGLWRATPAVAAAVTRRCSGEATQAQFLRLVLVGRGASGVAITALASALAAYSARLLVAG